MTERVAHWRVATSPLELTSDDTSAGAYEYVGAR